VDVEGCIKGINLARQAIMSGERGRRGEHERHPLQEQSFRSLVVAIRMALFQNGVYVNHGGSEQH
jgi:hypothetical protein